jgi:hypothetical protein
MCEGLNLIEVAQIRVHWFTHRRRNSTCTLVGHAFFFLIFDSYVERLQRRLRYSRDLKT